MDVDFRRALVDGAALRAVTFPLFAILSFFGRLASWEFLYHLPNVSRRARERLFLLTIEGTFTRILEQFYRAVSEGGMRSFDGSIDYAQHYERLTLPVSFVAMALDGFVDPPSMIKLMCDRVSSEVKHVTLLPGIGHEDFFMNERYFVSVLEGIEKLEQGRVSHDTVAQAGA